MVEFGILSTHLKDCFFRFLRQLIDLAVWILFGVLLREKKHPIPPIRNKLLLETATSLALKIRTRQVQCVDVVSAFISRIKDIQPILNPVVSERFGEAIEDARQVDNFIQSGVKTTEEIAKETPFLGIPFTTKDSVSVKGLVLSAGLVSRKGVKAEEDAEVVALLRKAGAIPIAISNVSELCMWWESNNNLYGRTRNPYDTSRTVGGSSGGEGCLLGVAGSVISIGSDIGGSIRIPAFFNGVYGLKPSSGILSSMGKYPPAHESICSYLTTGPMCRYASDLKPLLKVLAGNNASKLHLDKKVNLSQLKIYYMDNDGGNPHITKVHPEVLGAQKKVLVHFEKNFGIKPLKVSLTNMKFAFKMWNSKMMMTKQPSFSSEMVERNGELNTYMELLKWCFKLSDHTFPAIGLSLFEKLRSCQSPEETQYFVEMCDQLQLEFQELLADDGVFLYPPHPEPAPCHNEPILKFANCVYTAVFNSLGLPALQCPVGLSQSGIPLGVQIVTAKYNDHLTLAVATEIEKAFGGWINPSMWQ
ncbi:fatty-acid amide hydrolase 2-like isoform X2 [Tachypleus tridentatus]